MDHSLSSPEAVSSVMASGDVMGQKCGWEIEKNRKLTGSATGLCDERKSRGQGDYGVELLPGIQGGNTNNLNPLPPLILSKMAAQADRSEGQEKPLDVHIDSGTPNPTDTSQSMQGHRCKDTLMLSSEQRFSSTDSALECQPSVPDKKREGSEDPASLFSVPTPIILYPHKSAEILTGIQSSSHQLDCSKEIKLQEHERTEKMDVKGTLEELTRSQEVESLTVVDLDSAKDFSHQPMSTLLNAHASPCRQLLDFAATPSAHSASLELQSDRDRQHLERFKEAATMTISEEESSHKKKCQDIEIQATADMFSRSAATSPYLFPPSAALCPCKVMGEESEILIVVGHLDAGSHAVMQEVTGNAKFQRQEGVIHPVVQCQVHRDPSQCADHVDTDQMIEEVKWEKDICKSQKTAMWQEDRELRPRQSGLLSCTVETELPRLQSVHCRNTVSATQTGQTSNRGFHDEGTSETDSQHQYKYGLGGGNLAVQNCSSHDETPTPFYQGNTESREPAESSTPHAGSKKTKLQFFLEIDPAGAQMLNTKKVAENKVGAGGQLSPVADWDSEPALGLPVEAGHDPEEEADWDCGNERVRESSQSEVVQDVLWDEQGMTWEVYGAALDPESLGVAIQSHLQTKIKEQERKVTAIRKSISSEPPQGRKEKNQQRNVFRLLMQNIRRPNCCTRPPPSSVQD